MEAMRQSWSDDRLDDLNNRVDAGFARVDERFARVDERFARLEDKIDRLDAKIDAKIDARIDRLDAKVDAKIDAAAFELRGEMKEGFHQLNCRFDAMQQTFIRVGGGLIGVLVASGAGLIATQL
jgi:predicted nuclease with TOPRIM domain